jgi:hypothetical protein
MNIFIKTKKCPKNTLTLIKSCPRFWDYYTNIILSGKDRENKKLYLFSEFKPGYAFVYVGKAKSLVHYYNGLFSLFGFRYKF